MPQMSKIASENLKIEKGFSALPSLWLKLEESDKVVIICEAIN
jgi:hypothetical protein